MSDRSTTRKLQSIGARPLVDGHSLQPSIQFYAAFDDGSEEYLELSLDEGRQHAIEVLQTVEEANMDAAYITTLALRHRRLTGEPDVILEEFREWRKRSQ